MKKKSPSFKIDRCPTCGSQDISWIVRSVEFRRPGSKIKSPPVPHWFCASCGERLFDSVSEEVLGPWQAKRMSRKSGSYRSIRRGNKLTHSHVQVLIFGHEFDRLMNHRGHGSGA